ncbi:NADH-quinone oxidoreductase subunit M [Aetokthonos hydrillicola Thurmond2011]|jgi:NAD(P)H-quinone oxidoreductase subunit 4|uniref:NADH-quinone oxidoreductase subunit M n=1 Tax=Aetokthonos hydrillicola Thurmond2011 TaxID=2712845 RepID=A0AAP5M2W7_9CYAN|nr:NADH-quinone oxidoreductase subunit M [Aetokthonos hydrillicola]MBO3463191.1 NADH-quinone oxidoreductase subunit M [Aetokthonos hydrillicola CCALA 1050]MBW4589566.1 NADH-quinone oxidoreductase subunit M [Aetokthonos hydrillicola CCALA 1050]MDR9893166.1 NADH-quinone oxidoreductase subunit M [Aetokthonos hydrillicola Thurmond2011]
MLSTLIWVPIIGAAVIGFSPGSNSYPIRTRWIALITAGLVLLWNIFILLKFDISNPGMQLQEYLPWNENLGLSYKLGVDGLSILMLLLNSFLTWIAIYSSSEQVQRPRIFYSLILLVSGGVAGAFLTENLLLFFLFYELELIPFYLLISIWGGEKRAYAAIKFLIYTAVSGALILAAFFGMVWLTGSTSFNYDALPTQTISTTLQIILLFGIVVGFGIKIPLVPFHTWLPDAYVEASSPIAILLGGVLAKLGTYGLLRFGMGMFPQAWSILAPTLATWGAISAIYGAVTAIAQKDIKRMVAYSSIGHMGYILLASAASTRLALVGAVSQMFSHGIILAILFHLIGVVENKVGTRELDKLNGLMSPVRGLPLTSALLVIGGMASAGIPGMIGFVAEFIVFQGSFSVFPIPTLLCIASSGLTAVYFVILLNRTCFGKLDNKLAYYPKVEWSEKVPALILTIVIFFLGIQPTWLVRWSEPTTTAMLADIPTPSQVSVLSKRVGES